MDNIFGVIVLVVAWHICGDDPVAKGPQNYQFFSCYVSFSPKTAVLTKTNGPLVN